VVKKRLTRSRPWYSRGTGGMRTQTSSVISATIASTSYSSKARTSFASSARSTAELGAGGGRSSRGISRASVARARLSALVTDCSVVARSAATSRAEKSSTSRRIKTARCFGGNNCKAVINASETASRASYLPSVVLAESANCASRWSG